MDEFDDSWITNFENKQTLKIIFLYIDKEKTIYKSSQEIVDVYNNILTRDEIVKLIINNKKKHKLCGILSYIVNESNKKEVDYKEFMSYLRLQDISLAKTSKLFESINTVFFLFEENDKKLKQNTTKKVFVNYPRKTRRKALKANST
jgi:hypothetical protein